LKACWQHKSKETATRGAKGLLKKSVQTNKLEQKQDVSLQLIGLGLS
jgi:hypothetical protein